MLKKINTFILIITVTISIAVYHGCTKKEETGKDKDSKVQSELIKKDDKGTKVDLKLKPKVGDKYGYKMVSTTTTTDKGPITGNKDFLTEQEISYFFTQEVSEISSAGVITYKMKYDSIKIITNLKSGDSSLSETYNSNIKDSTYAKLDFVQHNAIIGQEFRIRVSPQGEVYDVYELEKIHENVFKIFGDTLTEQQKASLKSDMDSESLKNIIQNQYQKFPLFDVYKDSLWTYTVDAQIPVYGVIFPVKNNLQYKLADIKETNGDVIVTIDASMGVEFESKERKENTLTVKIEESEGVGKGTIIFNLTKGCVVKKETKTNLNLKQKLSARGQSAKSLQTLSTMMLVEML